MKTERTTTQRSGNRYGVKDIVTAPAYSAAAYRGLWLSGIGIWVAAIILWKSMPFLLPCTGILVIIGALCVGTGWGGDSAIKTNWQLFKEEVLNMALEDKTEVIHDDGERYRPATKITEGNNSGTKYIQGKFAFTRSEWVKFVKAVQGNRERINTSTIRAAGIFTNAAQKGTDYVDEFMRLGWVDEEGQISDVGYNWLIDNGIMNDSPIAD